MELLKFYFGNLTITTTTWSISAVVVLLLPPYWYVRFIRFNNKTMRNKAKTTPHSKVKAKKPTLYNDLQSATQAEMLLASLAHTLFLKARIAMSAAATAAPMLSMMTCVCLLVTQSRGRRRQHRATLVRVLTKTSNEMNEKRNVVQL